MYHFNKIGMKLEEEDFVKSQFPYFSKKKKEREKCYAKEENFKFPISIFNAIWFN